MTSINIVNSCDLDKINDLIHDCSFDIDAIENEKDMFKIKIAIDNSAIILKRKCLIFKQFEIKEMECILCIYGVNSYNIVDPCKIGIYCLNKIDFNSKNCSFSILCAEPVTITVNAVYFKVSLSMTDKIIRLKKRWKVFTSRYEHGYPAP